ncbi:uncharacterized protein L969DRAFT_93134 [Mixia osmundae IAM 14324]|uniref:Uncharacterized protein n=1 Tax=Mixia osmundae (strain CBS 9802 / IAM 14324 / JCM 22182 / KY 12970) TaxID=764103 RepID=G7E602_MIXOS|nr:uncharacterized protein L969DRAFT_93134 [Mixia osmundae IAM 14324]KEI40590.1 hypothetical protein L969DRAFT_93134 [Mixia osmundae IAM 14324]GAA98262.1 hypothetical protein E5Q_04945 [Mixia osmundae IAM 14324]
MLSWIVLLTSICFGHAARNHWNSCYQMGRCLTLCSGYSLGFPYHIRSSAELNLQRLTYWLDGEQPELQSDPANMKSPVVNFQYERRPGTAPEVSWNIHGGFPIPSPEYDPSIVGANPAIQGVLAACCRPMLYFDAHLTYPDPASRGLTVTDKRMLLTCNYEPGKMVGRDVPIHGVDEDLLTCDGTHRFATKVNACAQHAKTRSGDLPLCKLTVTRADQADPFVGAMLSHSLSVFT